MLNNTYKYEPIVFWFWHKSVTGGGGAKCSSIPLEKTCLEWGTGVKNYSQGYTGGHPS